MLKLESVELIDILFAFTLSSTRSLLIPSSCCPSRHLPTHPFISLFLLSSSCPCYYLLVLAVIFFRPIPSSPYPSCRCTFLSFSRFNMTFISMLTNFILWSKSKYTVFEVNHFYSQRFLKDAALNSIILLFTFGIFGKLQTKFFRKLLLSNLLPIYTYTLAILFTAPPPLSSALAPPLSLSLVPH